MVQGFFAAMPPFPPFLRSFRPGNASEAKGPDARARVGRRAPARLRIALLNVKYSPNLGDGLLAECLERELSAALGGAEVFSIDIAGRTGWPAAASSSPSSSGPVAASASRRRHIMALLEAMPPRLRHVAAGTALALVTRWRLRPHIRTRLAGCHAAVIGGGNLLTDADLNFPTKLAGAAREVTRRDLPLAIHAVGASGNWSAHGRHLFARALARRPLAHATVRDERSREAWTVQLVPQGAPPARVVGDPGLLASLHYPHASPHGTRNTQPGERRIGLCVTAPLALRYHVGQHHQGEESAATGALSSPAPHLRDRALIDWYGALAHALARQGMHVVLFTNGSPEDRECLVSHAADWTQERAAADWIGGAPCLSRGRISLVAPFATPADLARFVAGCDLVIAHRMHACIAAHSFAVPTIGLTWDAKLASFFALAGRSRYAVDGLAMAPVAMAELALAALDEGVDRAALDRLIAGTRADVAALGARIAGAIGPVPAHPASPLTASAIKTAGKTAGKVPEREAGPVAALGQASPATARPGAI